MSIITAAAELVLEELLRGIDCGDYLPGERLNAASLSKRLGLSLAPVREALHILAGQGVVELLPKRGAILTPMTRDDVHDYWVVLVAIGRVGIELATPKMTHPANARALLDVQQTLHHELRSVSGTRFYHATYAVHNLFNEIADNRFLSLTTNNHLILYWERFLANEIPYDLYREDYVRNYDRIIDSVLLGDVPSAIAAWEYHVRWSLALINGDVKPQPGEPWVG